MKKLIAFVLMAAVFTSCQKTVDWGDPATGPQTPASGQKLYRIQQGTDPDLNKDTIWHVIYNAQGRISAIRDSLFQDSIVCTYDAAGRLTSAAYVFGHDVHYTYDANGLLVEANYNHPFGKMRDVFTYNNGVIAKKSTYTENRPGAPLELWTEDIYTVSGGNIVNVKEVYATGSTAFNEVYEYGTEANQFKDLSLINFFNMMGTYQFAHADTYFNKNMVKKITVSVQNDDQFVNAITLNSDKQVTKLVSSFDNGAKAFTWFFAYK